MAKRQNVELSELYPIDNIPEYTKQRRSPAPKRRTHFSMFLISSSSSASRGCNSDKRMSSILSTTEDNHLKRGNGKREQKAGIRLDELKLQIKPVQEVRRFRIMRHLGLVAPIGSPF